MEKSTKPRGLRQTKRTTPRQNTYSVRGGEGEVVEGGDERLAKAYQKGERVTKESLCMDKVRLKGSMGTLRACRTDLNQTRWRLGAPPKNHRESAFSLFGAFFNTAPCGGESEYLAHTVRSVNLELGDQRTGGANLGIPTFSGAMSLKPRRGKINEVEAMFDFFLNPTRGFNRNAYRILDRSLDVRDRFLCEAATDREHSLDLKGGDNVLPYGVTVGQYREVEHRYLTQFFSCIYEALDHSTQVVRDRVENNFGLSKCSILEVEHYLEREVESATAFVDQYAAAVVAYKRESQSREHGHAYDVDREGNSITLKTFLASGEWIKIYAKTETRVRFEVTHQPKVHGKLLKGGYEVDSEEKLLCKLDELAARAAQKLNEFLGYIEEWEAYSPQQVASSSRFSRRWFKVFNRKKDDLELAENLLDNLKVNGRICRGGALSKEGKLMVDRAEYAGILRRIQGVLYPHLGEDDLTDLSIIASEEVNRGVTHCEFNELPNPLFTGNSLGQEGVLASPPMLLFS